MVVCNMADLKLAPKEGGSFDTSQAYAESLDKQDSLADKRAEFAINGEDLIYVDGNSLGRLPKRTLPVIQVSRIVVLPCREFILLSNGFPTPSVD